MQTATRLDELEPYLFATLAKNIEEKRAQGVDVINLGSGDPDTPTCAGVVEAMRDAVADPANHRYPTNRGKPAFLHAVARFLAARFDVSVDVTSEIVPTLGGKEAVHHLALCALSEGDICLYPEPAYPIYKSAATLANAKSHVIELRKECGFLPDLDAIPADVARRAKLLFINYPNNPTTAVADVAFFEKVVRFAKLNDIFVVHDNAYSEICFDDYHAPSFLQAKGAKDVGVEIFSLSKGWNMTGWRIGFIAGNEKLIGAMRHLKPNIDAGPFGAIQDAAITALEFQRSFPQEMSRIYQERRDIIVPALRRMGLQLDAPKSTLFLWAELPATLTSTKVSQRLFDEAGVVVSAGRSFGPSCDKFIRLALTAPTPRLIEAARRFGELRLS